MKEDLGALTASLAHILSSVGAIRKVAAKFEYTAFGKAAEAVAESLQGIADDLSELITARVREGGNYE